MYSFADFQDNAPTWQELEQLVSETKSRLGLPDVDLEAVSMLDGCCRRP